MQVLCYPRYARKNAINKEVLSMASTLVQFRIEDSEKIKACDILDRLGITLPSYLRMCVARLNQENGIPFSMKLEAEESIGINALKRASHIAEECGITNMSLDEINVEIAEARK